MFHLPAYLLCIGLVFITTSYGQLDPSVCPQGPTGPNPNSTWRSIPPRFEITCEFVANKEVGTVSQAFSTGRDAATFTAKQGNVLFSRVYV